MIQFFIPGEPQGKGRPKFARRGNHVTTYTPEKTQNYEELIKRCCIKSMKGEPMLDGPLVITICACYAIPKSTSRIKAGQMRAEEILPTKKPDFDNIEKVVCDALNGIAYKDDAQIVKASFYKHYGDVPEVNVFIEEIKAHREADCHEKN